MQYINILVFGLLIPAECPGVPASVLQPRNTWPNVSEYDEQARKLAAMFVQNFVQFADAVPKEVLEAGPKI